MSLEDRWTEQRSSSMGAAQSSGETVGIDFHLIENAWNLAKQASEEIGLSRVCFHYSAGGWSRRFLAEWESPGVCDAWRWTTTAPVVVHSRVVGVFEFQGDPLLVSLESCSARLADLLARFENTLGSFVKSAERAA